jgi:hypothetical protein
LQFLGLQNEMRNLWATEAHPHCNIVTRPRTHEVGLAPDGVYTLAEIINRIVSYRPGSTMSELLRIIFNDYKTAGDLEVNLAAAV